MAKIAIPKVTAEISKELEQRMGRELMTAFQLMESEVSALMDKAASEEWSIRKLEHEIGQLLQ